MPVTGLTQVHRFQMVLVILVALALSGVPCEMKIPGAFARPTHVGPEKNISTYPCQLDDQMGWSHGKQFGYPTSIYFGEKCLVYWFRDRLGCQTAKLCATGWLCLVPRLPHTLQNGAVLHVQNQISYFWKVPKDPLWIKWTVKVFLSGRRRSVLTP